MDFDPLSRMSIGFDRLFNVLENVTHVDQSDNYPPYNIEKIGDAAYRITLAVAGFTPDELSITTQLDQLIVSGKKAKNGDGQYLYQGIAGRAFVRQFGLADSVKITGANLTNGMLSIDMVREMPEAMKPRRIEITDHEWQIDGKIAT
jgi:molecular chaperone IbpA